MELWGTWLGNWAWADDVRWIGATSWNPPLLVGSFYALGDVLVGLNVRRRASRHYTGRMIVPLLSFALTISPVTPAAADRAEEVDAIFARWSAPDSPGCAVSVIEDGQLVFASAYGQAHLEHDVPVTPTTIFHVASVSKQFVCFAVCLLAADGAKTQGV